MPTYTLSEWDHERQRWDRVATAKTIFGLRREIRRSPFLDRQRPEDSFGLLVRRGRDRIGTRRRIEESQPQLFT